MNYGTWRNAKVLLESIQNNEKAYYRTGYILLKESGSPHNSIDQIPNFGGESLRSNIDSTRFIKARACFQEWLEINPNFRKADIFELIGDWIFKNEKEEFTKALQFYEDASKINSESVSLAIKQGRWYEKLQQNQKAIEFYEKAVELNKNKNSIPLFRLAWANIRWNNLQIGIDILKEALIIEPNNSEMLNKLGETLLRLEKDDVLDDAKQYLRKSIKL